MNVYFCTIRPNRGEVLAKLIVGAEDARKARKLCRTATAPVEDNEILVILLKETSYNGAEAKVIQKL